MDNIKEVVITFERKHEDCWLSWVLLIVNKGIKVTKPNVYAFLTIVPISNSMTHNDKIPIDTFQGLYEKK